MSEETSKNKINTIVVRFPNWIGDCVMALPALRALKQCLPETDIYIVAKEYLRGFFRNIGEIKDVIFIPNDISPGNIFKSARILRSYSFARGILFTNSFASALLFRLAGIGDLLGYKKDLRGFLLSRKLNFPDNDQHHSQFYLELIAGFWQDLGAVPGSDQLVVNEKEQQEVKKKLAKLGVKVDKLWIGMSTSAAYGTAKEWLPRNFSDLINRLLTTIPDSNILLFGSDKESEKIKIISQRFDSRVVNLAGKLTLRQSIEAISLCRLFISNDSGLMHVAAGLSVPLVAIFGPTLPHKTAPLSDCTRVLHHDVHCAPCLNRECPETHQCMEAISVEEVLQATISLLRKVSGGGGEKVGGAGR